MSMAWIPDVIVLSINYGCMWLHSQPRITLLTAWTREACSDADATSLPVSKMVMSPPMAFAALTALRTAGPTWSAFDCATTKVDIYSNETYSDRHGVPQISARSKGICIPTRKERMQGDCMTSCECALKATHFLIPVRGANMVSRCCT